MVLMWIENLALHMAERDTKVWKTSIMVKKKTNSYPLLLIHSIQSGFFSYNYADMYHILMLLAIYETFMIFKNSGRYPETLFSKILI